MILRKSLLPLACLALLLGGAVATAASAAPQRSAPYDVAEKPVAQLEADFAAGKVTSEQLVRAYLARIAALDRSGPTLRSVIAINPNALAEARAADAARRRGEARGPLQGLPILIKDNIETADPTPTTAGSLALVGNVTGRDAPLVARLRRAGAVILGKANLSEWANMRSSRPTNGWSAAGGMTRNPYALDRSPCGSSAGSAVAAAASLAAATVGTETDGSIVCPAAMDGVVGLKPTVGLIPRTNIVPITRTWDTPGPIGRSVRDVAALLTVIAGSDPSDAAAADAEAHRADYVAALDADALKGRRLGVLRFDATFDPRVTAVLDRAVAELKAAGAEVVEIDAGPSMAQIGRNEYLATITEYKAGLDAYLAAAPPTVKVRSLADLVAFNDAHAAAETPFFGQERLTEASQTKGLDDPAYRAALATALRLAGPEGVDKLLADNRVDALVAPTTSPAETVDLLGVDRMFTNVMELAAVSRDPHLTVPMGDVDGLPVGLSFIGPAWSEARLLAFGYAYEQRTHHRRAPTYVRFESLPGVAPHLAPSTP